MRSIRYTLAEIQTVTACADQNSQLAKQFVACLHFVHRRHDFETLGPGDKVRDVKQDPQQQEGEDARLNKLCSPNTDVA